MNNAFRHKKPFDITPSKFIVDTFAKYSIPKSRPILDLACGYGRHSLYFSNLGHEIVSADFHEDVFVDGWFKSINNIHPIILDGTKPMPFRDAVFGGAIVVHFYSPGLFNNLNKLIAKGGLIFYESIGGQGSNWMELGKCGQVKAEFLDEFNVLSYKEIPVGPEKLYSTLKMVARKKQD